MYLVNFQVASNCYKRVQLKVRNNEHKMWLTNKQFLIYLRVRILDWIKVYDSHNRRDVWLGAGIVRGQVDQP